MNKMALISDLQYFPTVIYFSILSDYSDCVFEQYEHYEKMSFRNRCMVAGAEGLVRMSIPLLEGRNQKTAVKNVRVDNRSKWQTQHFRTLVSCYSRSPWFEFYHDELEKLFQSPVEHLLGWNLECLKWVVQKLEFSLEVSLTQEYIQEYDAAEVTDLRGKIKPKTLNQSNWPVLKYAQVFEERTGFIPNLSILDLLFCEGPNARNLLRRAASESDDFL
jgi:hypothetical protein